jgi:enoyl-CoA hydratase
LRYLDITQALNSYGTLKQETPSPGVLVVRFSRSEFRNPISAKMGHESESIVTGEPFDAE